MRWAERESGPGRAGAGLCLQSKNFTSLPLDKSEFHRIEANHLSLSVSQEELQRFAGGVASKLKALPKATRPNTGARLAAVGGGAPDATNMTLDQCQGTDQTNT
uniref:Uncharacterized protein n=1 Tax=Oryza barthii TaxID=65489 RepID=A0A0D3FR70_9ORYZ